MEKTANIIIEELRQELVNKINSSGLPISVLEMIVGNIYKEIAELKVKTLNDEIKKLEESKKESAKDVKKDNSINGKN